MSRRPRRSSTLASLACAADVYVSSRALGHGSFGAVYEGSFCGHQVAVKLCAPDGAAAKSARAQFDREMRRYRDLKHPCITQFFGVAVDEEGRMLIVTELMRGGSLFSALGRLRDAGIHRLAMEPLLRIALNVANGLCYLHSSGFSSGDIKSMNILLSESFTDASGSPNLNAKLCDFGLSRRLGPVVSDAPEDSIGADELPGTKGPAGTYAYLAPECFSGLDPNDVDGPKAADMYALGIVLWELLTCGRPWWRKNGIQIAGLVVVNGLRPPWPENLDGIPEELVDLVEQCWHPDPKLRPTADEVRVKLDVVYGSLPNAVCPMRSRFGRTSFLSARASTITIQEDEEEENSDASIVHGSYSIPDDVSWTRDIDEGDRQLTKSPASSGTWVSSPMSPASQPNRVCSVSSRGKESMQCTSSSPLPPQRDSVQSNRRLRDRGHHSEHRRPATPPHGAAHVPRYTIHASALYNSTDVDHELAIVEKEEMTTSKLRVASDFGIRLDTRPHWQ